MRMIHVALTASVICVGCGGASPAAPSSKTPTATVTAPAAPPVCTALVSVASTTEGPYLDVKLSEAVAKVEDFRQDNSGVEVAPHGKQRWDGNLRVYIEAWFDSRYRVKVTCKNGATQDKFVMTPRINTGGSQPAPVPVAPPISPTVPDKPQPPACVFDHVTWVDPDVAIRANRETATVPAGCEVGLYYVSWGILDTGEYHRIHVAFFEEGGVHLTAEFEEYPRWEVELRAVDGGAVLSVVAGVK